LFFGFVLFCPRGEAWTDSRMVSFALPLMKVFKLRLNFSELF
jgi:hypothetical protein